MNKEDILCFITVMIAYKFVVTILLVMTIIVTIEDSIKNAYRIIYNAINKSRKERKTFLP
jgi:hypothetical protein